MFFAIPNLRATPVFNVPEPWNYTATQVPDLPNKKAYREYCANPATKHAFISAVEGMDPRVRASYDANNPPFRMHGLVVDYDAEITPDIVKSKQAKPPSEFGPVYVSQTFSGNARALWMFEKPVLLASKSQYKKFVIALNKHIKFRSWFAGFETESLSDPTHYYEIGSAWQPVFPEYRIPANLLDLWLFESSKDIPIVEDLPSYDIPVERLAAEVEVQYPGRWTGPFDIGKRGVRFWDPTADCPTGAIVRPDGMLCFTGPKGFVSWREIFGSHFVEQFEADRISAIREVTCYDGRAFWVLRDGRWQEISKDDFAQFLRVQGFRGDRKGAASEIDRVENDIKLNRAVRAALPFVHMPTGVIIHKGEPHLNYSTVKAMAPAPPVSDGPMTLAQGKQYFPWLWEFFSNFFEPPRGDTSRNQLWYFLAWLKHFYQSAKDEKPKPGQIVVIAGPTGRGKTFLVRGILGPMVGGYEDASNFLVDGSQWTDHVCEMPIMAVDDSIAVTDPRAQLRFSALIKKIAANTALTFNGKWKKQGLVPWYGRITITSNLDPESLRILPNMEINILDKISLFKAAQSATVLPGEEEQKKIVARELPYFCRWLLDWQIPDEIMHEEARFGVKAYHHIELHQQAVQQGSAHNIYELILEFCDVWRRQKEGTQAWVGRGVALFRDMALTLGPELMGKVSMHQLTTGLGMLESRGLPIKRRLVQGSAVWTIPLSIADPGQFEDMKEEKSEPTSTATASTAA